MQVDAIERGEDRIEFKKSMDAIGIEMARSEVSYSVEKRWPSRTSWAIRWFCALPIPWEAPAADLSIIRKN